MAQQSCFNVVVNDLNLLFFKKLLPKKNKTKQREKLPTSKKYMNICTDRADDTCVSTKVLEL